MKEYEIISQYKEYLRTLNKAEKTIQIYQIYLLDFFKFLCNYKKVETISNIILYNVTEEDIYKYLWFLSIERENKTSIKNSKLSLVRSFYKWLLKNNPEINNPTQNIYLAIRGKRLPKTLTYREAMAIQKIYSDDKNRLIMQILVQTGVRLNELSTIKIQDVNFLDKSIKVIGKGNKERVVLITNSLAKVIRDYIQKHNCSKYLFEGDSNGHVSNSGVRYIVYNAYKMLGIENKGYTVHTLRHTFASIMYQKTKDILLVKEMLGHQGLNSTQIYIHINQDEVKNAVDRNPLNDFVKEGIV